MFSTLCVLWLFVAASPLRVASVVCLLLLFVWWLPAAVVVCRLVLSVVGLPVFCVLCLGPAVVVIVRFCFCVVFSLSGRLPPWLLVLRVACSLSFSFAALPALSL